MFAANLNRTNRHLFTNILTYFAKILLKQRACGLYNIYQIQSNLLFPKNAIKLLNRGILSFFLRYLIRCYSWFFRWYYKKKSIRLTQSTFSRKKRPLYLHVLLAIVINSCYRAVHSKTDYFRNSKLLLIFHSSFQNALNRFLL